MRLAFVLLALTGCASANTEQTAAHQPAIYSDKSGILLGERPKSVTAVFGVPPVAVWVAVKKVYADLGIPITVDNPPAHQLGNNNFNRTGRLVGRPMTDFLDCGHGISGSNASTFRIYISLITEVTADPGGAAKTLTTFTGSAQDMSGSSTDRVPCGSTGRFEEFFLDRVRAEIGPGT
jgi:hypothetical protein